MTTVLLVPYESGQGRDGGDVSPRQKRELLWADSGRNTFVADLVAKLVSKPRATLRKFGIDPAVVLCCGVFRPRIAVLVEGTRHARLLGRKLPRWAVDDAVPVKICPGNEATESDADAYTPAGTIVTLVAAARHGVRADVVVRATVGHGKLDTNWFVRDGGRPLRLIVDVADAADAGKGQLGRDAESRRREYRGQGMKTVTAVREESARNK